MEAATPVPLGDTFDDRLASIAQLLKSKKSIVVLAGAGISVSCGIPDFRSKTGLYATLDYQELGLASPEDLFDIETFRDDPRPFFRFAHSLYPGSIEPSASHRFLASLDRQGKLLRIYTQNIDTLEQVAGVRAEKVVYAHGSLLDATCTKCKSKYGAADIADDVKAGTVPLCRHPPRSKKAKLSKESSAKETATSDPPVAQRASLRRSAKRTLTKDESNFEALRKQGLCCGVVKPNITFFGEKIGNDVGRKLQQDKTADALIVMGTSLSVAPMSKVVEYLPPRIPKILINRNIVCLPKKANDDGCGFAFDHCLLGNCDDVVEALEQAMKGDGQTISDGGLVQNNDEQWLLGQPKESVLLFPGAVTSGAAEPEPEQKILVHCDECKHVISGKIWCCTTCFDFDLCDACHSNASSRHFDGKHEFVAES